MGTGPIAALNPHLRASPQQAALSAHAGTLQTPLTRPSTREEPAGSCALAKVWILFMQLEGIRHGRDHGAGAENQQIFQPSPHKYGFHMQQCTQKESMLGGCHVSLNPTMCQQPWLQPAAAVGGTQPFKDQGGAMLCRTKLPLPQCSRKPVRSKQVCHNKSSQHTPHPT